MKSELRKIQRRKWFRTLEWNLSELKELNSILTYYDIPYSRVKIILDFKKFKVKNWLQKYRRLNKITNV